MRREVTARDSVLIVEDERLRCEEMAGFSAPAGIAHAPPHAARPPPDYNLPDMTGLQVAEQLRAFLPETAILIASGRVEGLSEQALKTRHHRVREQAAAARAAALGGTRH